MCRFRLVVVLALLSGLLLMDARPVCAQDAGKRVAVVNIVQVFNAYKRVKDITDTLKSDFEKDRSEIEKKQKELVQRAKYFEEKRAELQSGRDEKLFIEFQDFQLSEYNLKRKAAELMEKIEGRRLEQMKLVLKDIRDAIAEVAKDEGADIVVRSPEFTANFEPLVGPDEKVENSLPRTADQLVRMFRESPVLYFHDVAGVNLTQKVSEKLNAKYPGGKAAGPIKPPGP